MTRLIAPLFTIGLMIATPSYIYAQDYPKRPIRIITSPIGGGNDFTSRVIAQEISGPLGQPVIVENRPTLLLGELVAKALPDGYTLLVAGGTLVIGPLLKNMGYDPVKDFSPITLVELSISVVVVNSALPIKSISELIAYAKAKPGALNYATTGIGAPPHLAAELLNSMAGIKMVQINYKGTGPAINDLLGGQVQVMFASTAPVAPHVKSGRLRALAVTGAQPTALVPGLPTVAAAVPGYESSSLTGLYAPAKTPTAIINRLNQETVKVLQRKDVRELFLNNGVEVIGSSPQQLASTIKLEIAKWGKVIKDANIQVED